MRTEYIAGKAAMLFTFLLFVTLVPAMLLLLAAGDVRRQLRVPDEATCSCSRRSPSPRCCRSLLATFTMLALSSLSKSAATSASCTPASSSSPRRSTARCCAITGSTPLSWISLGANLTQVVDVIFRLHAALRDAVAGLADRHPRPDRAVDLGPRAARARRGGGDVSAPDRHRRARLEVVRAGHRPERRHASACRPASPACSARTAPASRRS